MKKLYEIDHEYLCSADNYFDNNCSFNYKTWTEFLEVMGEAEDHFNLIFRWDWKAINDDGKFSEDDYYRDGILSLYYMNQRKGQFVSRHIEVCKKDDDKIRIFLKQKFNYLVKLWEPFDLKETE